MFHHFHDDRHAAGQGAISRDEFAAMIDHLGSDRILPAGEFLRRAQTGALRDTDLCLTFDDNLRCQYDVALPVLRERGMTAFWFVYTSVLEGQIERLEVYRKFRTTWFRSVEEFYEAFFNCVGRGSSAVEVARRLEDFDVETYLAGFPFYSDADRRFRFVRDEALGPDAYFQVMDAMIASAGLDVGELAADLWMDAACLRELQAQGHVIGLHSHTHPTRVGYLDEAGQRREYAANRAALERLLGRPPVAMSHPCNSYNDQTLKLLRGMGVRLGFRANMARPADSELEWPREDHANVLAEMRQCA